MTSWRVALLHFIVVAIIFFVILDAGPLDPVSPLIKENGKINEFIRYHEAAKYDPELLLNHHHRIRKRSLQKHQSSLRFVIHTKDRTFRVKLVPDTSVFSNDVEFTSTSNSITTFDPTSVYVGTLQDDETASVHGLITNDGLFDGTISTKLDDYYIEPMTRYHISSPSSIHHSIIYKSSDVIQPQQTSCPSQELHLKRRTRRWLPQDEDHFNRKPVYQNNRTITLLVNKKVVTKQIPSKNTDFITLFNNRGKRPPEQSHASSNDIRSLFDLPETQSDLIPNITDPLFRHVNKRATIDPKKTTCMLYLQADHQFFQKYGTEEACIEVMTRHVQRVNAIYRVTDFNQDGKPDNITFMIKRIKVHTKDALKDTSYRFPSNYGVEKFLELFSEEDYDAFCLAYMFTYRDFEMGTLGLAWTGDLKNAGGVCEKNGHYRGSMKSLNTGIVTLLNYGKHVPPAVSHVTLAHEIGHNFGSPHDPELCTPGGEDGNFIMFARATSGDKKNNNQFSPCSLKSINPVLNYKARSTKGCFTEPQTSLCGNGVVEEGEECDCGWEEDCADQCCHPQRRHPPIDEPPCRLTTSSICSPSQGPCCTSECQLKFGDKCRDDNGCRDASFCDGRGPYCPLSINKPNKTICNREFVCFMGECTGSICLAYGLESCQCIPTPKDPKTKACELCCKIPGDNQPCLSSFSWNEMPYDIPDMYSKPGTPCNDYNGYCDVFQKCREVDPSGPLATLRKMILSEESIASFKKYLINYWYIAFSVITLLFAILVLTAKIFGKPSNPKLKQMTIIHSSTQETVRLPPTDSDPNNPVTIHPAIRSKLPLKQKVRNGKKRRQRTTTKEISSSNNSSPKKRIPKKSTKSGGIRKKKTIDYSKQQKPEPKPITDDHSPQDPVNKVQNWLLKSQLPVVMPKSKSTPVGLTGSRGSPKKSDKSKSVGHLPGGGNEKMRLQVVYKPPFKFSVKLRKADKSSVVLDKSACGRVADRSGQIRSQRTGLLIRSKRKMNDVTPPVRFNATTPVVVTPPNTTDDLIDSNIHTVQSDLEVLLSESEFLFSDT